MKLFPFAHNTSIRHEVPPKLRNKLSGVYNENPAYKYNFFSCKLRGSNPTFPINLNFPSILRIVKRPLRVHETYRKYYSLKDFSSPLGNNVKTRTHSNSLQSLTNRRVYYISARINTNRVVTLRHFWNGYISLL